MCSISYHGIASHKRLVALGGCARMASSLRSVPNRDRVAGAGSRRDLRDIRNDVVFPGHIVNIDLHDAEIGRAAQRCALTSVDRWP
jgi:hypothetical protein